MILIVDNYDSFVHNIARYFTELGARTRVKRRDEIAPEDLVMDALVISPGPCTPREAAGAMDLLRRFSGKVPILGVCLGHQCIGEAFGGTVARARRPMHGDSSRILHDGSGLFAGIPAGFKAGRYHSLVVGEAGAELEITARSEEGEIMALKHRSHPTYGVQFHPESILTEYGYDLLRNFLKEIK
jgi:anthranilate synthase component 2/para-aminobenzoate synthetase component 2